MNGLSHVQVKEKSPYKPHWVTGVKKGRIFKYKRKEMSSPRIFGDVVFLGSDAGIFYAMKKKNGHKIWRFKTDGSMNSAPAFEANENGGTVFVGNDNGHLYAISASKGKEIWKVDLGSEILTAPQVVDHRLLVSTQEGRVAAVSTVDGHILWDKEHRSDSTRMSIRGNSQPVLDESTGRVYIGFSDGILWCLASSDGKLLWEKALEKSAKGFDDIDGAPLVSGDQVFVATYSGGVYSLSKTSGNVLWSQKFGSGVGISEGPNALYVSSSDGHLYALNKKDGTQIWSSPSLGKGALTAPVFYKDLVIVGLSDETINFVDAKDGHLIAHRFAKKGVNSDPVVDENFVYYFSNGGKLYSLKLLR